MAHGENYSLDKKYGIEVADISISMNDRIQNFASEYDSHREF